MKPNCIFLVFGNEVKKDFSNVKSITTKVVPNIGESIIIFKEQYTVVSKNINYSSVEDYDNLNDADRGKETIWIYLK